MSIHPSERHACPWCSAQNTHYMTHVCPGCTCWFTEVEIPGEPQLGSYLEGDLNPDCPIHGDDVTPKTPRRSGGARTDAPAAAHTTHPTSLKE